MNASILEYYSSMKKPSLVEYLNASSFDELIELNLSENTFRFVYNNDAKYVVLMTSGMLNDFVSYVAAHNIYPDDRQAYLDMMDPHTLPSRLSSSQTPGAIDLRFRIKDPNGNWKWVEQILVGTEQNGIPEGFVNCYIFDIQYIKDREMGVNLVGDRSYIRDELTGLLREKDFFEAAQKLLSDGHARMMIALDLENFKLFNDWYGRDEGDRVLSSIGKILDRYAHDFSGVAGYLGQDDFCLLVRSVNLSPKELFSNILGIVSHAGVSFGFQPSIGCAQSEDGVSVLDLYDRAALASRHAKDSFKQRICVFDKSMYRQTAEDYRILSDFQQALSAGEIIFFLQPQCRASSGKIVGAESLARWRKPDGSYVPPSVFIPPLEKHGFISDLDMYIWDKVCAWIDAERRKGMPLIPVSVNVSQVDIFTMNVPEHLTKLLKRYDLPGSALKVEITESACAEESGQVRDTIAELRRRGFTVLMDDFGSGYSSLNVLHEMSFDVIKLDMKFLHLNKASVEKGIHILESVVNMAKTLGIPIIVEGVETENQKEYLTSLGCRYVQGYYFYRPMLPADFERLISHDRNVDTEGFVAKNNDQFRVREFLNDTVYSDAMLNNIIGPVAIYSWHGDNIDIVRYNQQFYESVGVSDFSQRLTEIEKYMPAKDIADLRSLLDRAMNDRLNGASGILNFYRSDGGVMRFLIHFYFLEEVDGNKRFYGSARDITEIANLNNHMKILEQYLSDTIIFQMRRESGFSFQIAAHGLENVLQISRRQLASELESGEFFMRVVPEEQPALNKLTHEAIAKDSGFSCRFHMTASDGRTPYLFMKFDPVPDPTNDVKYIISLSLANKFDQ